MRAAPVKQIADEHSLAVIQPVALDDAFREQVSATRPDLLVVVAYGLILPRWLLAWPRRAAINLHASLLPRWRGAAPIQRAILAGDEVTGVSVMQMSPGLDRGPVYLQRTTRIGARETSGELHDRLAEMGAELLVEALPLILAGSLAPKPQDEAGASYAPKLEKRDAILDWRRTAIELERQVRAYNPWPVAEARTADGERLRIWSARVIERQATGEPGAVVESEPGVVDVATGEGLLRLERVQSPGSRAMNTDAYLAAHDIRGTVFVTPD